MKKLLIGTSAIAIIAVGGYFIYQKSVKPKVENAIVGMIENAKAEIEARGDGSSLNYDEVSLEGAAAVITNVVYVDGNTATTQTAETLTVSATQSKIHSAIAENYAFEKSEGAKSFTGTVETITIKDFTIPPEGEMPTTENIEFGLVSLEDLDADVKDNEVNFTISADKITAEDFNDAQLASQSIENLSFLETTSKFGMSSFNSSTTNVNLTQLVEMIEAQASGNTKINQGITYEAMNMSADFEWEAAKVGDMQMTLSDASFDEAGFYTSFKTDGAFNIELAPEAFERFIELAESNPESDPKAIEGMRTFQQAMETAGIEAYGVSASGSSTYKDGMFDLAAGYDLKELAQFDFNVNIPNFDMEKFYKAMESIDPALPSDEFSPEMMAYLSELKIGASDISISGPKLLDIIFELNPKMPRQQAIMTSQMMIPMMLKTEPTIAPELAKAVGAFLKTGEKFEIHIAPEAPVAFNEIMKNAMLGQEIAPLLGVTVIGE